LAILRLCWAWTCRLSRWLLRSTGRS